MSLQDIRAAVAGINDEDERHARFMQLARVEPSLTDAERRLVEAHDRYLRAVFAAVPVDEIAAANEERVAASAALNDYDRDIADIKAQYKQSMEDAATRHRAAKQRYAEVLKQSDAVQERIAALEVERAEAKRALDLAAKHLAEVEGE